MSIRHFARAALLFAAAVLFAPAAHAAEKATADTYSSHAAFGPRIGISSSPDQLVVGGQLVFPDFAPQLSAVPSVELGFLDNETTVAINGDLIYHFVVRSSTWKPYAGAGAALEVSQPENGDSSTDAGMNLIVGADVPTRTGNRFFGEFRIGVGDISSLKIMVGWNFPM
jgi:hypothetical protein